MDEEVYTTHLGANPRFDTDVLRFEYSSMTTPWTTFDYGMGSRERTLKKRQRVEDPDFDLDFRDEVIAAKRQLDGVGPFGIDPSTGLLQT